MKIAIKKLVSVILIVAIILSSNGVFTFADSIDDVLTIEASPEESVVANQCAPEEPEEESVGAKQCEPEEPEEESVVANQCEPEEPEEESVVANQCAPEESEEESVGAKQCEPEESEEESVGANHREPEDDSVGAKLGEPEDDSVVVKHREPEESEEESEEESVGAKQCEPEDDSVVASNESTNEEETVVASSSESESVVASNENPNEEETVVASSSESESQVEGSASPKEETTVVATASEVFSEIIASSSIISEELFGDIDGYILTNEWTGSAGYAFIGTSEHSSTYRKDSIVEITIATRADLVPASPDWTWNLPNSNGLVGYVYDTNKILIYASENKEIYADANGKELFSSYISESTFQSVETINNLHLLNTSLVTTMDGMFKGMNSLASIDLSNFDVHNVTDMSSMFFECESLTSIDISHFDTGNVTDFSDMFNTCSALLSIDMSNLNTTNVTSMSGMFNFCDSLQSVKLKNMSNNNLTDISNMFAYCTSINEIDLENFKTDSVTNMRAAFMNCSALQVITLKDFKTSNVTDMSYMFYGDGNLQKIIVSDSWSTEKITNPQGPSGEEMFMGCSSLVGGRGTTIESMIEATGWIEQFATCAIGAKIDYGIGSIEGAGYLTEMPTYIFAPTWFNNAPNTLQKRNIHLIKFLRNSDGAPTDYVYSFELNDSNGLIAYVRNCSAGLYEMYDLEIYPPNDLDIYMAEDSSYLFSDENDPTEGFIKLSEVTNLNFLNAKNCRSMSHMFDGCRYLVIFSDALNTENVTNMSYMFYNATGLQVVNLTRLDTKNVTNMSYMFYNTTSLTVLNLSGLDTRKVTDMSYMFSRAKIGVMEFDISSFDTSNVANMSYMFANCTYISTIYVSPLFTTKNVTDGTNMFDNCERLRGADGTRYDNKIVSDPEHAKNFDYAKIDVSGSREGYFTDKVYYSIERNWCNHNFVNYSGFSKANINRITFERGPESEPKNYIHTWDIPDGRGLKGYLISETEITIYAPICASIYTDAVDAVNMFYDFVNCEAIENLYMLDTSKATDLRYFFYNCQKVKTLDLSTFNTKNVTDMGAMFWGCHSLVSLDVSNFDTSNVTSMWRMFENCSAMKKLDLSNFDVRNVRSFVRMFQFMTSLEELDISNFNTLNGNDFQGMFLGLTSIKVLNLTSFRSNSSSPLYFYEAFSSCYNLKTIYVSRDFPLVGTNYDVFSRCYNLVGGEGTGYTSDHIGGDYARIDEGPSNPGYFTLYGGEIHGDKAIANLKGNGGRYSNGATSITIYVDEGAATNTFEIPTRSGYDFDKYLIDGSPINNYWTYGKVEKDVVASWKPKTYKIIYHPNGGTGNMPTETVEYGKEYIISPNVFTRAGYSFNGWALSTNSNVVYSDREIFYADEEYREEINLYANWLKNSSGYDLLYNITWDLTDGTIGIGSWDGEAGDAQYLYGIGIDTLPTNVKGAVGREFDHWEIGGTRVTSISPADTGDKIVKAVYRNARYNIHWSLNGGSWEAGFTPDATYTYGVGLTLPANRYVPANGKSFSRWLLQFEGSETSISATEISETSYGNVSVIAECVNRDYNITYIDENGNAINWDGDTAPASYTYGTGITYIPANVIAPANKEFDHWEMNGQRVESIRANDTGDKTLVARYKNKKYNIIWNLNQVYQQYDPDTDTDVDITIYGDWKNEPGADTYTYGTGYVFPASSSLIITPGFYFDSWWIEDATSSVEATEISSTDSGDKTVQASYRSEEYNITWNLNGAQLSVNADASPLHPTSYMYGDVYIRPLQILDITDPDCFVSTPDGKVVSHWTVNGVRATEIPQGSMGDLTISLIYADTPSHNIIWDYGTGDDAWSFNGYVPPATYSEGTAVIFPDKSFVQTANGRELDYFTVDGVRATEIASTSTTDVTVSAVLKNKTYRIKYNLGGGSFDGEIGSVTYTHGTAYTLPTNVIGARGQEFDHWEIDGVVATNISATDYGHKEFTAVYRNRTYNITWDIKDATISVVLPNTYTYGTEVVLPAENTIRGFEGRKFAYWTVNGAKLSSIPPTQVDDVTVELHYLTYSITWELGDAKLTNYVRRDSYECGVAFVLPRPDQIIVPIDYVFEYWLVNNVKATEISSSIVGSVTVIAVYKSSITPGPTVDRIKIQNKPNKLSYTVGETIKPDGLIIRVIYSDNTTKDVVYDDTTMSGFRLVPGLTKRLTTGDTQVIVIYFGKVAAFDISVKGNGGGGNGGGGSGGGGSGGSVQIPIIPVNYINQVKEIYAVLDIEQVSWQYDPIANKFKLNINVDGVTLPVSNGFYLINNKVYNITGGAANDIPVTETYYFDALGNLITGWIHTIDNKWYYCEAEKNRREGQMVFGWHKIQDKWYYFLPDGSMLENSVTPDGYIVGADGAWVQIE